MTKKIYGFWMLVLVLLSISCKQDPPILPANLQNTQLIGKWQLTELVIGTKVGSNDYEYSDPITGFPANDYFQFDRNNQAVLSSTIYNKAFQGYYSANTAQSTLAFKSGDFLVRYNVIGISLTELKISETLTDTDPTGTITLTTNIYTYNR